LPSEILNEILAGKESSKATADRLLQWINQPHIQNALLLDEKVNGDFVDQVLEQGYGPKVTDTELEVIGRDPFLIAYAMVDVANRCIVTTEVSAPSKQRQNRKLPDVSEQFGVLWLPPHVANRNLGFTTNWKS
jgi:hypothetical protein